jgi:hypothetical protein
MVSTYNPGRSCRAARFYVGKEWVGLAYGTQRFILRMAKQHQRETGQRVRIVCKPFARRCTHGASWSRAAS